MTTVGDIINLALKDIGVIAAGETADADTASDSLATLGQLIGQWQASKVYVTGQQEVSVNANGSQTYTVGPGGNIDIPLPVAVDGAFWRSNGIDYPLHVLSSFEDYEAITFKALPGVVPNCVFYKRDYAQGTLYVWPQPSTGTINLVIRDVLPAYAGLTDDIAVPAEYALALRYSLGELLLTTFGLPPRQDIAMYAARARKVMKRANLNIPILGQPQELLTMVDSRSTRDSDALRAAWESMRNRSNTSFDDFARAVDGWDIVPAYVGDSLAGAVLINGPELHACILPQYFRRWLSMRLMRRTLYRVLADHGYAITKATSGNDIGNAFVTRLGFHKISDADGVATYRLEAKHGY